MAFLLSIFKLSFSFSMVSYIPTTALTHALARATGPPAATIPPTKLAKAHRPITAPAVLTAIIAPLETSARVSTEVFVLVLVLAMVLVAVMAFLLIFFIFKVFVFLFCFVFFIARIVPFQKS